MFLVLVSIQTFKLCISFELGFKQNLFSLPLSLPYIYGGFQIKEWRCRELDISHAKVIYKFINMLLKSTHSLWS